MSLLLIIISSLPYLSLVGLIWGLRLRGLDKTFFQSCVNGALIWSLALWAETNILSAFNLINGFAIGALWIIFFLLVLCLLYKYRFRIRLPQLKWTWGSIITGIILLLTLVSALAYPPQMWDVMSYHLPRVEHWLQNHTLAPYFTNIPRQIGMPPFNAMIALQSIAPGNYDYFVNLGQWLAFAGILAGVAEITAQLGGGRLARTFAVVFMATLPAALIQASNTESSDIVTFWIIALVAVFLKWRKTPNYKLAFRMGACLGLAILSKGSAYPIAFPIVALIAWQCVTSPRKRFMQGVLAACLIIAINAPHLYRTYKAYGTIVGGTETNILMRPTPATLAVNAMYNFLVHEPFLLQGDLRRLWSGTARLLGVDEQDKAVFPWGGIYHAWRRYTPDDSYGQSPCHAILLLLVLIMTIARKFRPPAFYSWLTLASFLMYFLILTWHPWTGRIHASLFALAAPITGIFCKGIKKDIFQQSIVFFLCVGALVPLLASPRPIGPSYQSFFHFAFNPRQALYFNNYKEVYPGYMGAVEFLKEKNPDKIGLILYDDAFEYPLWAFLAHARLPQIEHVNLEDISASGPEYIFVQQKGKGEAPLASPVVLQRQGDIYVQAYPVDALAQ